MRNDLAKRTIYDTLRSGFQLFNYHCLSTILSFLLVQPCTCNGQEASTKNPLLDRLINEGFEAPSKQQVFLPPPVLQDGMNAAAQDAAISPIAKPYGVENFYNERVSAPYNYKHKTGEKLNDGAKVRIITLYFIAFGELEDIVSEDLLKDVIPKNKRAADSHIPENSRELSPEELRQGNVTAGKQEDGSVLGFASTQTNLIDKVYLDIVTKSQSTVTEESVTLATYVDLDLAAKIGLPSTWQPINRVKNIPTISEPKFDFRGAAGYAKATKLKGKSNAIFVELHIKFVEPDGWFRGLNLLTTKLGTVVKTAVPDFRRKLARAATARRPGI